MANNRRKYSRLKYKWLYTRTAEAECDNLRDFVYTMSGGMAGEAKKFDSLIERITAGMDEDQANEVAQHYDDEAFGIYDRYPRLLWQSVFISLYAFFEQEMNGICRRVRRVAELKMLGNVSATIPDDLLPAQKCLTRFGVRLAVKSAGWKRFLAYKAIRNIVVHNHGKVKNDSDGNKAKAFTRRHVNIEIDHNCITLNSGFCFGVIEDMRLILIKTIKSIPQKLFEYDPPIILPPNVTNK